MPSEPIDLAALGRALESLADRTATEGPWRSGAFAAVADSGLLAGYVGPDAGGIGMTEAALVTALTSVAERCLTTALVVTQWAAAVRIIAGGPPEVRDGLLPQLIRGESFTTVGISHLTTSRRHLGRPSVTALCVDGDWQLDGICPWVTGADSTHTIVTGAATADGSQLFFVVPADAPGLTIEPPLAMLALSGSRTSAVRFAGVRPATAIPAPATGGPRTGGLSTTALAVGAARASRLILAREAAVRPGLATADSGVAAEIHDLESRLLQAATRGIDPVARDRLRADANGLVVRAAQAALTASKGAGFVSGHPAERRVRESLFFLVWSCPQAVTDAFLCDLTGG
ncbi:MAG: acyl-CoA dehydrogenase family protein [Planctomycetaceae bacterium]